MGFSDSLNQSRLLVVRKCFLFGDCLPAFPIAGKAGDETAMLPGAQALTVRLARWALT